MTPAPAAMRRLRDAFRSSGFARSARRHRIDDALDARDRALVDLRALRGARELAGQLVEQRLHAAHLAHLPDLRLEVLEVEALAGLDLLGELLRLLDVDAACCASSISDSTSPMPRMRDAMRSGWNTSRPSSFSATPTNLIGAPVTWRTDSAAPPRASPSSLVRMTPVSGSASRNALRRVDRVLALHRVDDEQRLDRLHRGVQRGDLAHHRVVDREPARGVDDHARRDSAGAPSRARASGDRHRLLVRSSTGRNRRRPGRRASASCSIAAGR